MIRKKINSFEIETSYKKHTLYMQNLTWVCVTVVTVDENDCMSVHRRASLWLGDLSAKRGRGSVGDTLLL